MTELTELERLQKAVVDTAADHAAFNAAFDAYAANANYVRAKENLAAYLKEQDNV